MSELSHYIKLRSSPSGCDAKLFECDKYLDCESCLEDKIKEHDKQIRVDAIDEFAERLALYLGVEGATKYGNENAEQMNISYNTTLNYEIADAIDDVREQLKEQKK